MNGRPALRVDDPGIHAACCGMNTWVATQGSATVFVNGKAAHRIGDQNRHCGGVGQLVEGSSNVIVGASGGSGASSETGKVAAAAVTSGATAASATAAVAVQGEAEEAAAQDMTMTGQEQRGADAAGGTDHAGVEDDPEPPGVVFVVKDHVTKQPLADAVVLVELPSGERKSLITDGEGRVDIKTKAPGPFKLIEVRDRAKLPVKEIKKT